jgi:hypothetical protein
MKQKMIYISDELYDLLSKELNGSRLIEKLLREHYDLKENKYSKLTTEELIKLKQLKEEEARIIAKWQK